MERISAPSPKTAVMRAPMPSFTSGHQLVAHAPHGEYVLGHRGIHLDLGAQAPDVHVDQAPVAEVVVAPDPVEQLLAAEHLVGAGRQLAQQAELGPGAVHLLAVEAAQHPLLGQQLEVAEGQRAGLLLGRPGPAQQGADAGGQLLGHERLGDVVVGARLQPGHDVVGVRARRHDDDRHRAAAPQGAAALEAVHAGQHQVDERDVGRGLGEHVETLLAAGGVPYLVAFALQGEAHGGSDALIVLDDQNASAHRPPAQLIQIWVGQMEPPIMPKAVWPCGVVGLLKFCTVGVADDRPDGPVGPQVGEVQGQALVHRLVGGLAHALLRAGPAGQEGRLDGRVGVAGHVDGQGARADRRRAPEDVVEVGVHGTELAPAQSLVLAGQRVVDGVVLLDDVGLDLEADLLPGLLEVLGRPDGRRRVGRAVGEGDGTAVRLGGRLDQLGGLARVVGRVLGGRVVGRPGDEEAVAHREDALVDDLGVLLAVDGHGGGPPDVGVVERLGQAVELHAVHVRLAGDVRAVVDVGVAVVAPELRDDLRGVGDHQVDGARLERLGPGRLVGDRLVGDLRQVRHALAPVVGVGRGGEMVVGDPLLEHEGPGADRVRRAVGVGQHGRRRDVGDLAADAAGQVVGEGTQGSLKVMVTASGAGLGDGDQGRAEDDAGEQRLGLGLEVREQRGAVARRAVVEHDVGAQRHGPRGVRGVGHHGLGQVGRPVAVGQNDGQRVEDGAGVHDADLVEPGLGRVEARLLGVHAEDQRAAVLGRFGADPVLPGPLVVAPAMSAQPEGTRPGHARDRGRPAQQH